MSIFQIKFKVLQILFISAFCFAGLCDAQNESNSAIGKSKMSGKEKIVRAFELAKQKESFALKVVGSNVSLEMPQSEIVFSISSKNLRINWSYKDKDFQNKELSETIVIDATVYQRDSTDLKEWKVKKRNANYDIDFMGDYEKRSKLIKNVEFIGQEKIDDTNTDLYQYDFDIDVIRDKSYFREVEAFPQDKIKIWIGSNGLPMKIEYSKKFELSKSPKVIKTEEKFNFDENVKIIAPNIENGN